MALPRRITWVRHAESEQNWLKNMLRTQRELPKEYEFLLGLRDFEYQLTPLGLEQARTTGDWLRAEGLTEFHGAYVSDYRRARQTAKALKLGLTWDATYRLVERSWGLFDSLDNDAQARHARERVENPLYWRPPDGESLAATADRVRGFLGTLARRWADQDVIVVAHGEVLWCVRIVLEGLRPAELTRRLESKDPKDWVNNCQVLDYSRFSPSGKDENGLWWVRSVCPWDTTRSTNDWSRISRPLYDESKLDWDVVPRQVSFELQE